MAEKSKTKEYSNGEITVVWKPEKCIHSGICVETLPKVYNPKERPWIKIDNATTEELKSQVEKCPSGALSYYVNGEENQEQNPSSEPSEIQVKVLPNGPLQVFGTLKVTDKDGNVEVKNKVAAFCRCGASSNKPYCDGAHKKVGFEG